MPFNRNPIMEKKMKTTIMEMGQKKKKKEIIKSLPIRQCF